MGEKIGPNITCLIVGYLELFFLTMNTPNQYYINDTLTISLDLSGLTEVCGFV